MVKNNIILSIIVREVKRANFHEKLCLDYQNFDLQIAIQSHPNKNAKNNFNLIQNTASNALVHAKMAKTGKIFEEILFVQLHVIQIS